MKLEKKNQFELEKISGWFQTGKKSSSSSNSIFQTGELKNPVQIDKGPIYLCFKFEFF